VIGLRVTTLAHTGGQGQVCINRTQSFSHTHTEAKEHNRWQR